MRPLFTTLLFLLPFFTIAQDCDCTSNFEWLRKTFEENDAGFAYALEAKGKDAYEKHNALYRKKAANISELMNCTQTLYQWLTFFRTGHIGISLTGNSSQAGGDEPDEKAIREQFKDWEKMAVDLEQFKKHLSGKKTVDFEGIWESSPYLIGIKKEEGGYVGFIIEADGVYWTGGQVKLKIRPDESVTYYMRDHSEQVFPQADMLGNNNLQMGFISLQRVFPKLENTPEVERYLQSISALKPYFEEMDEQTLMLRIPDFSGSEKRAIDSVILHNRKKILSTENLIIDLRNNGGGSDYSFYEILPLIYTNPIRTVGMEFRSTPMNNQRMLDFIENPDYDISEEEKQSARDAYEKLSQNIGEFVNLDTSIFETTTYDTVFPYPKKVGILINGGNASTTEQFLLAAKQSQKVKLFGTTTIGMLDISNMHSAESPCGEFLLHYCLSKSYRIPDMAIDGKGIQPDFYIDDGIPKYGWIEYVREVLAK